MCPFRNIAVFYLCIFCHFVEACTAFICNGKLVHAFDWSIDKARVIYSPTAVKRSSESLDGSIRAVWQSKFSSYTFALFAKDLPQEGMNDQGLVVVGLLQNNSAHPPLEQGITTVNELQFIQYALDNFSNTAEVLSNMGKTVQIKVDFIPMHYLVYDAKGDAAVIEFVAEEINIVKPDTLVLTNDPYDQCYGAWLFKNHLEQKYISEDDNRYCSAAHALDQGLTPDEIFSRIALKSMNTITELVQQVPYHTRWKTVFDPQSKTISFSLMNKNISKHYSFRDAPLTKQVVAADPELSDLFTAPDCFFNHELYCQIILSFLGQRLGFRFE